MKRILVLIAILLIAGGSLYLAQHRKRQDEVSVNAVVDAAADWQRDLTRVPMHLTRLSDDEETRIGNELAQQYASSEPPETAANAATERYLNEVGDRVAAHAHRKLTFRFHLIADSNTINAFALPGGHVFVGQGLLDDVVAAFSRLDPGLFNRVSLNEPIKLLRVTPSPTEVVERDLRCGDVANDRIPPFRQPHGPAHGRTAKQFRLAEHRLR